MTFAGYVLGLALIAGILSAYGQQAPTENKGITIKQLAVVDLGPEIEGMAVRQLRIRMLTIEPGGIVGVHSHKDRPGTAYVLSGKIIEHRGDTVKEYGAGDAWPENKDTMHWLENKGTIPVVLIAADVFKQP